jgi:serine/threonine protein kinase
LDGSDHIGRYEVLGELGRGGQGTVYQAHDPLLDREVAIKVLDYQADEDSEYLHALQREARLAAALDHPYVTTVHDFLEEGATPYIVMEYLPDSLDRHLRGSDRLDWGKAVRIAVQVAQALGYAHSQGIVHRDIKPQNILLRENGDVSVADFGLARASAISGRSRSTGYGGMLGTPEYMAPEQWSEGPVDGRVDQYALGVLLYQMISGYLPFEGDIPVLYSQHKEKPFPRLSASFGVSLQGRHLQVDAIVQRATSKDPDTRYTTMEDMAADLESVLSGLEISEVSSRLVKRPSLLNSGVREVKRRPWALVLGVAGVVALLVVVVVQLSDGSETVESPVPLDSPTTVPPALATSVPATTEVAVGGSTELINEIADWHERWDEPGLTIGDMKSLSEELTDLADGLGAVDDPYLALAVEVYITTHALKTFVTDNVIYRVIDISPKLGAAVDFMETYCDLPSADTVSSDLRFDLSLLELECFSDEMLYPMLGLVRQNAANNWIDPKQFLPLSPVTNDAKEVIYWIGNWHSRFDRAFPYPDSVREMNDELSVYLDGNEATLENLDVRTADLVYEYEMLHSIFSTLDDNVTTRGAQLFSDSGLAKDALPDQPCDVPGLENIPKEFENAAVNLDLECETLGLSKHLLVLARQFAELTWLDGFVRR